MSLLAAPIGFGFAFLLYAIPPVVDRKLGVLNQAELRSESLGIERALIAVHESMVELPDQDEARAIASLASINWLSELQNHRLSAAVHKLEAQYVSLVGDYEVSVVEQQESVDQMRSELRRLQHQQEVIVAQIGRLIVEHDYALPLQEFERDLGTGGDHAGDDAGRLERAPDERSSLASWVPDTGLSALVSPIFPALQIARALEDTRREAMRSKRDQRLIVDVERRIFGMNPGREFVQLDPVLNLRLDIASSEIINKHSGRIRFFPDGSSTGGRIQLQRGSGGATVDVDWSTGTVTVQVLGD